MLVFSLFSRIFSVFLFFSWFLVFSRFSKAQLSKVSTAPVQCFRMLPPGQRPFRPTSRAEILIYNIPTMYVFINLRTSSRRVFYFITPILRPPNDCAFFALGLNSRSIFRARKHPRNLHACEMARPLSAGHLQDIHARAQMSG